MENSFSFECTCPRIQGQIKTVNFDSADGTEWRLTEEWLISTKKTKDIIQRLIFIQENNYNRRYFINLEITCNNSCEVAGRINMMVRSKQYMTKITIPIQQFNVFKFCVSNTSIQIGPKNTEVREGVTENYFRYKVTINRAYVLKHVEEELPNITNKLVIFSDQMLSLLESGNFSDAILTDGNFQIRVHRCILSARSNFFKSMFTHDMRENKEGIVYIPDTDFRILNEMVRFMYCGILRGIDIEIAHDLFYAADKYEIKHLRNLCWDFLLRNIRPDNVRIISLLAWEHPDKELKNRFISYILDNFRFDPENEVLKVLTEECAELYEEMKIVHEAKEDPLLYF